MPGFGARRPKRSRGRGLAAAPCRSAAQSRAPRARAACEADHRFEATRVPLGGSGLHTSRARSRAGGSLGFRYDAAVIRARVAGLALLALVGICSYGAGARAGERPVVILLSWDGTRHDYPERVETPALARMQR